MPNSFILLWRPSVCLGLLWPPLNSIKLAQEATFLTHPEVPARTDNGLDLALQVSLSLTLNIARKVSEVCFADQTFKS